MLPLAHPSQGSQFICFLTVINCLTWLHLPAHLQQAWSTLCRKRPQSKLRTYMGFWKQEHEPWSKLLQPMWKTKCIQGWMTSGRQALLLFAALVCAPASRCMGVKLSVGWNFIPSARRSNQLITSLYLWFHTKKMCWHTHTHTHTLTLTQTPQFSSIQSPIVLLKTTWNTEKWEPKQRSRRNCFDLWFPSTTIEGSVQIELATTSVVSNCMIFTTLDAYRNWAQARELLIALKRGIKMWEEPQADD